jgi:hypothetical protein
MAAKSRWLLQIPLMLETLQALEDPLLDRTACEQVFGVGRRRAIYLMQQFGGYQAGNAIEVKPLRLSPSGDSRRGCFPFSTRAMRLNLVNAGVQRTIEIRAADLQIPALPHHISGRVPAQ